MGAGLVAVVQPVPGAGREQHDAAAPRESAQTTADGAQARDVQGQPRAGGRDDGGAHDRRVPVGPEVAQAAARGRRGDGEGLGARRCRARVTMLSTFGLARRPPPAPAGSMRP